MASTSGADTRLLRFTTAGSVDDGKSTLIGRLLFDADAVPRDQVAALERIAARNGEDELDLSLLTDGLAAEREQGITIDVAYRYFATARRKFIIADTPGHEQYTRNMVTGASTADAAVILLDARNGMTVQTRRHVFLAQLLGIEHLLIAVNKMDLVGFAEAPFAAVADSVRGFAAAIGATLPHFVPVSAKLGDNIVRRSARMNWYDGPSLLEILESLAPSDPQRLPFRFPVQMVRRAGQGENPRRQYVGRVESGVMAAGDEVGVYPSGVLSRIRAITTYDGPLDRAAAPRSIALEVADAIDIGRGDLLAPPAAPPAISRTLDATLCWFDDVPFAAKARLLLKCGPRSTRVRIEDIAHRLDPTTAAPVPAEGLARNDIARVRIIASSPLAYDGYSAHRATGAFILIDEETHATVSAGILNR